MSTTQLGAIRFVLLAGAVGEWCAGGGIATGFLFAGVLIGTYL